MANELVTVIVPCAPSHFWAINDALRSIAAQTALRFIKVIVVFDSAGEAQLDDYPFPLEVLTTGGGKWTSYARNLALQRVTTPLVTFLDADDALTNISIEIMGKCYAAWPEAGYIYGDAFVLKDGQLGVSPAPEYSQQLLGKRNLHTVTALMRTCHALNAGGFDESLHGWEDWEFYMRLADQGVCGKRVEMPLITYRLDTGMNREKSYTLDALHSYIVKRHVDLVEKGVAKMGCGGGCGGNTPSDAMTKEMMAAFQILPEQVGSDGLVVVEYTGTRTAPVSYNVNGQSYRASSGSSKFVRARPADVPGLEALGVFRRLPAASTTLEPAALSKDPRQKEVLPPFVAPFEDAAPAASGLSAPSEAPNEPTPKARKR